MTTDRLQFAKNVILQYGDKIPLDIQNAILAQRVVIGMPPYEASLAAGEYTFSIVPDPSKWMPNSDPYRVIEAQSLNPDASVIILTFQNDTQFPGEGNVKFKVTFEKGKASSVERLGT